MYLKRVEIFGFKSFAEKTELEFGPGITAVVGPNGSGKSNVADAIRWVLGEQSARALRGGNMADVIFAGSDGKRAMGYAQVSLLLDNTDGQLGVDFAEVMVTRRVDRSGEGEYFINQVPCRLRDIHELFMDTGLGKESYSIIGQGRIDEVLSSKPEDRRALFEEAAGISRYKARKREAQRRLSETEQNLLRITDIIGELQSQMETLAEQARRAELFREWDGERRRLDIGILAYGMSRVGGQLRQQVEDNESLRGRLAELQAKHQATEEALEVARNLAESLDQELSVVATQLADATGHLERAEGRLALAVQEEKSATTDGQRLEAELARLADKLTVLDREMAALSEEAAQLQQGLAQAADGMKSLEAEQCTAQGLLAQVKHELEERKNRIIAILQQEAEKRNALGLAQRDGQEAQRRRDRLGQERRQAEAEAAAVEEAQTKLATSQLALLAERDTLSGRRDAAQTARQEEDRRLALLQQQGTSLREQIQATSSRLGAIEEMINAFEGYQKGTRTVLQGREKSIPFASDVEGAVAELIRTDREYERAIEVALGGGIQNIVTRTDEGAQRAIQHLKRVGGGRATFLPLNTVQPRGFRPEDQRLFQSAPGILGVALDLVHFDERYRPAMASLLGRVLIAQDMKSALAFGKRTGMRFRIVTLDGEVLAAGGALTGGSLGGRSTGLLSREREREELVARLQVLESDLVEVRRAYAEAQSARHRLDQEIQQLEQELRTVETRITQAESEGVRLAGEARRWADVLQTYDTEAQVIDEDARQGTARVQQLQEELAQLGAERERLEAEVASLTEASRTHEGAIQAKGRELTAVQVRLAELNQALRSLQGQQARVQAEQDTLKAQQTAHEAELAHAADRLSQAIADRDAARTEVQEAGEARQAYEEKRNRLQSRKLQTLEQVNSREREVRSLRRSHTEVQNRLQQGELKEAKLRMEQETLVSRLHEQHQLQPAEVADMALPDDEIAPARERMEELREQIQALGPVNIQAIEEYRNAQERYEFLQQQRTDLDEAKSSLYRAVEELDKRIQTHFVDSFHVIRQEFQQTYQELFQGGRADLKLVDENNLLETGIEITAQPPGKKSQPLSLLSGGERAMTAIALLFAFLRVKPAPFVILDEVEAALDEANVERFGRYLRNYADLGSQFICITHQRGTMEVADALYGVTMEGTGVSRVVSVRLVDLEQEAG